MLVCYLLAHALRPQITVSHKVAEAHIWVGMTTRLKFPSEFECIGCRSPHLSGYDNPWEHSCNALFCVAEAHIWVGMTTWEHSCNALSFTYVAEAHIWVGMTTWKFTSPGTIVSVAEAHIWVGMTTRHSASWLQDVQCCRSPHLSGYDNLLEDLLVWGGYGCRSPHLSGYDN